MSVWMRFWARLMKRPRVLPLLRLLLPRHHRLLQTQHLRLHRHHHLQQRLHLHRHPRRHLLQPRHLLRRVDRLCRLPYVRWSMTMIWMPP